ncbi:MAG TPA: lysoplasmalogenase [Caulobacteraceae bacterium]|jgi:uncharacterized membrane protein YhhN
MSEDYAPVSVGGTNVGRLPVYRDLGAGVWIWPVSVIAALAYGTFYFRRPPSLARTAVKTAAVGGLAVTSALAASPWPLTLALALSALGDALLASETERGLQLGLASFLIAHLAYVALFLGVGDGVTADRPWSPTTAPATHLLAAAAVLVAALAMLAWLWPGLGRMRTAVALYVAAIVAMVTASLLLPLGYAFASAGALMFFASDAILAAKLFRGKLTGLVGDLLVWWLYYLGQLAIVSCFGGQSTF